MRALPAAIAILLAAACEPDRAPGAVRFLPVDATDVPGALVIESESLSETRALLLDAVDAREGPFAVAGAGPWRTRAVARGDADGPTAARRGRTYALRGDGDLQLEVRLGAGDRGAFAGGAAETGAERAMIQIEVADPAVVGARFDLALIADDGPGRARPRDVTPRHFARPLPKGRYRAWVDVPARGGRWLVAVTVLDRRGEPVAHAWSSPVAVVRPWL